MSQPNLPNQTPLLPELVPLLEAACDRFEAALKAGESPRIEAFLEPMPNPGRSPLLRKLLVLELACCGSGREWPTLAEYLARFPDAAEAVRSAFEESTASFAGGSTVETPSALIAGSLRRDYEILHELGRGGMGIVYRAFDRRRNETVALKMLRRPESTVLLRFKQEFHLLADITHPNLVGLYELNSDSHGWFFTMELVDGVDFLSFVRSQIDSREAPTCPVLTSPVTRFHRADLPSTGVDGQSITHGAEPSDRRSPPISGFAAHDLTLFQLDSLRGLLRQLARGLVVLHEAGRIHRDLKPSNVLVTRQGRVVILDFGLAAEVEPLGLYQSSESHILGTVAYMAPEQAAGQPVSAASDWYSAGVILYQALTGQLPFRGSPVDVLLAKQRSEPLPPSRLVPGIPEDLNALSVALLQTDAARRPTGAHILDLLGTGTDVPSFHPLSRPSPDRTDSLIGRERHLEALAETFSLMRQGRCVVVHVCGPSGSGKSTLVQHFLEDLSRRVEAVVLAGRCYERESVPYKALDGVIDALSRYLRRLPPLEADAVLPRDMPLLSQVFPVLQSAETLASAPRRAVPIPDRQELRRRTFSALRELLGRLGDRKPVVLWIDDLQWGDVDSAVFLAELLRPPDPPVLLLLGCYRSEDVATSPFLERFLTSEHEDNAVLDRRRLAVEDLTVEETKSLVQALFNPVVQAPRLVIETIARESGGNPFFASELVRYAQEQAAGKGSNGAALGLTLDQALWERIQRLPEPARRLLEAVAVAGRPILSVDACKAAALREDERPILTLLRSSRLIRSIGPSPRIDVEAYHDRVRETVLFHLAPTALTEHHRSLARTLEASSTADPEELATHFHGAGEAEKAGEYYALAASRAAKTLAFDRAVTYYRLALEIRPVRGEQAAQLRIGLGDALANAGRGAEAARAYLDASRDVSATEALELRRCAALQFLISGHVDAGLDTLRIVLASVGMGLPNTPRQALLSLLPRRMHLRLRGLRFHTRDASQVPVKELNQIDMCWSAVAGLSMIDPIFGALFQARHLLMALRAGEPDRLARAFAVEAMHVSMAGGAQQRRGMAHRECGHTRRTHW